MQHTDINTRIDELLSNSYQFGISDYLSQGFKLLQQRIGMFIGFSILWYLSTIILSSLEQLYNPTGASFFSYILNALWLPGFYIVARMIYRNDHPQFANFFDGHKLGGRLLGGYFLVGIIVLLPVTPGITSLFVNDDIIGEFQLFQEAIENQELYLPQISMLTSVMLLIGFIIMVYLSVCYTFTVQLLVFTDLGVWASMEASRKVVSKKWWAVFLLTLLNGLINFVGMIMLFVGFFFTFPATMCINYLAFEDVFKLENPNEEEDTFIDHIVE